MKQILLFTITSCLLYLSLSSNSVGPASMGLNATGSPGSSPSCGGCHGGGPGTTTASAEIRKLSAGINGPVVTQYMPDTNYIVTLVGNHPTLTHFGFQLTALNGANANVGLFSNLPTHTHTATVSSRTIVEHSGQLAKTNNQFEATFDWKAPATGTGTVTFYGIINAVDNNGQVSGDKPSNPFNVTLSEISPAGINDFSENVHITTYPNPVTDKLNISIENAESGTYTLSVFDMTGKAISTQTATVSNTYQTSINTSSWASGIYHVKLKKGDKQRVIAVMK